jgi:uncharacterized membrane protein
VRNGNKNNLAGRPCPACDEVTFLYNNIFELLRTICHQKPERSFFLGDTQFILCSRCSDIYISIIIICLIFSFGNIRYSYLFLFLILAIALLMNNITYINIFDTNLIRFTLGAMIGIPSGLIIVKASKIILKGDSNG